jgi:hypothetical protein
MLMDPALPKYLQDHLAGATFAVHLLSDLKEQSNSDVASLAKELLPAIEADRAILQDFSNQIGVESSSLKDAAAWMAQKAGRLKFDLADPLGVFEAIETLSLGVVGKLALWTALECSAETNRMKMLDFETLKARAQSQHRALETERLKLASEML